MNSKSNKEAMELDAQIAFREAIYNGILSENPDDFNYVGNYMYMGKTKEGKDAFKHIVTREYLRY